MPTKPLRCVPNNFAALTHRFLKQLNFAVKQLAVSNASFIPHSKANIGPIYSPSARANARPRYSYHKGPNPTAVQDQGLRLSLDDGSTPERENGVLETFLSSNDACFLPQMVGRSSLMRESQCMGIGGGSGGKGFELGESRASMHFINDEMAVKGAFKRSGSGDQDWLLKTLMIFYSIAFSSMIVRVEEREAKPVGYLERKSPDLSHFP